MLLDWEIRDVSLLMYHGTAVVDTMNDHPKFNVAGGPVPTKLTGTALDNFLIQILAMP